MIIKTIFFECAVPGVAPQYSGHSQLVSHFKSLGYFYNLPAAFGRAKINGSSNSYSSHIPGIPYGSKHDLVITVGIADKFVVIDLDNERYFMGVFSCHRAKHSVSGGNGIASAFNGQLYNVLTVKVHGTWCETGPRT